MSEPRQPSDIEQLLRAAGPPLDPPAELRARAREAALGPARRRPYWPRLEFRLGTGLAAAAAVAAVVAAFALGLGRGSEPAVATTISLAGKGGASGTVQLHKPRDGNVKVELRVQGLPQAPHGHYYTLWYKVGDKSVSGVIFNTSADGSGYVEATAPASLDWRRCWISEDSVQGEDERPVMRSVHFG
jgi:anti-sigma-K factor RskA